MPVKPGAASLYGGKVKMDRLAGRLTEILGRPVIDKTAFTDPFDLQLDFAMDDSVVGMASAVRRASPAAPDEVGQASDPSGAPNLFTAVRQQLGLKLESGKAPVEVIVIDHMEKPSRID